MKKVCFISVLWVLAFQVAYAATQKVNLPKSTINTDWVENNGFTYGARDEFEVGNAYQDDLFYSNNTNHTYTITLKAASAGYTFKLYGKKANGAATAEVSLNGQNPTSVNVGGGTTYDYLIKEYSLSANAEYQVQVKPVSGYSHIDYVVLEGSDLTGIIDPNSGIPQPPEGLGYHPNILFIIADDLSPRTVGVLGNTVIQTPALDSLANHGTVFTNAYNQGATGGAICISSRSMFQTGHFLSNSDNGANSSHPLWGEYMQSLGYDTYEAGKWHNGDASLNKSFQKSVKTGGCACQGYGSGGGNNAAYNRPTNTKHWEPDDEANAGGHWNQNGSGKHSSEFIADKAIDFLQNDVQNDSDPFFMYVSFNAPHDFRQSPTEYVNMYPHEDIDFAPNYMEQHPFDNGDLNIRDEQLGSFPRDSATYRLHRAEYYAIISHMDDQIRRVLDALEATGKADSTYIFFTADHGLAIGEHGLLGKQNMYEHSVKAPFFVLGPDVDAGKVSDALIYIQSAFPTSLEFAGASVPAHIDFKSVKEILDGERKEQHNSIYGRYKGVQRMVRTKYYKLIAYPNVSKIQLYRLTTAGDSATAMDGQDKYEISDLSERPEYAGVVSGHLRELKNLMASNGNVALPQAIESRILPEPQSVLFLEKDTVAVEDTTASIEASTLLKSATYEVKVYNMKGEHLGTISRFKGSDKWHGAVNGKVLPQGLYILKYFADERHQLSQRHILF